MTPSDSTSPTQTERESGFLLRWRGKQEGPFSLPEIERRIAANEIGLLHEIHYEGDWMPIRKFLELRAFQEEAARLQRAEAQRLAREQEDRDSREREAQQRNELLAEEKRKNDLLEAAVRAEQNASASKRGGKSSSMQTIGWLLIIGGGATAYYYFAHFDMSVATGGGGRVVNLGLMQDRQSGLILGLGMAVIGVLLVVFGNRTRQE